MTLADWGLNSGKHLYLEKYLGKIHGIVEA